MNRKDFTNQKKQALQKKDKSKKQSIDWSIKKLLDIINKKPSYYTTSSCSGRIVILEKQTGGKQGSHWHLAEHKTVTLVQVNKALAKYVPTSLKELWFLFEPFIVHICCETLDDADSLITKARTAGFKRSSIISMKNRIMVEITGTETIDAPLAIGDTNESAMSSAHIGMLTKLANQKMKSNLGNIRLLEKKLG